MSTSGLPEMYAQSPFPANHKCPCYNYYVKQNLENFQWPAEYPRPFINACTPERTDCSATDISESPVGEISGKTHNFVLFED